MTLNSSHTAGDTGHIADHNTIAAFVDTHDDVDTSTTAHHHSLGTAATQAAAGNHTHSGLTGGAASSVTSETVGNAAVVGTSTNYARQDHAHGMPAAGVASTQAIGDAAAQGVASTVALSDHKHGMPGFGGAPPQGAFNAAAGAGSATTVARSDHTHGGPSWHGEFTVWQWGLTNTMANVSYQSVFTTATTGSPNSAYTYDTGSTTASQSVPFAPIWTVGTTFAGVTIFLEAVLACSTSGQVAYAGLYDFMAGTMLTNLVSSASTTMNGIAVAVNRSASVTLTSGHSYTPVLFGSSASYTYYMSSFRVVAQF